uniref:Tetrapyrrole methylase domain-containing protein n=1 Tax=Paulinella chromatophora TaxID=39717 RepID=B1X3J8_PAUCH|nr:hypothetical protein PCC_0060 [Paulinella chromatophora]ACB42517.1 hypothetical protein PCC_0060 [Paulinella chromatophora]
MVRAEPAAGVLYLVGTPIGNLGDLSPRSRQVLQNVDRIACEDTRRSGQMLAQLGIKARLLSFHQRNETSRIPQLLEIITNGESLAVISDAGLPGISDPGEELVAAALKTGHEVICIPGPCALITALVISGLPTRRFCFEGFLPVKQNQRRKRLQELANDPRTLIIYESPHRLVDLLEELESILGNRPLQVARELTKHHEQQIGPNVVTALAHFRINKPQGECTVVIGGASESKYLGLYPWNQVVLIETLKELIETGSSPSEAARILSKNTGMPRRQLYALLCN